MFKRICDGAWFVITETQCEPNIGLSTLLPVAEEAENAEDAENADEAEKNADDEKNTLVLYES